MIGYVGCYIRCQAEQLLKAADGCRTFEWAHVALSVYHGGRWGVRATKLWRKVFHSLSTSVDGGGCSLFQAQGGVLFLGGLALQVALLRTQVREGGATLLCTQVH